MVCAYLLSQSSSTVLPYLALAAIFVLILLRPLRQHYLPEMTFTVTGSLLKVLIGGSVLLFVLTFGAMFLLLMVNRTSY
jgi:hypothetical protein